MSHLDHEDPAWQTAWRWVMREHEGALQADEQAQLIRWLKTDPAHFRLYEEACRIWLLSGLVPPEDAAD